jgi:uncharacterized OB-fold protein
MSEDGEHVEYDAKTQRWFYEHGLREETTVARCPACGLFYKPSLGHKCKRSNKGDKL